MATNHDQLMKELIATFPDQFLRLAAPEIAAKIDLGKLALEPQEHYADSPSKRARHADLIGRAPVRRAAREKGDGNEVVIHVEIELENRARDTQAGLGRYPPVLP